MIRVIIFFFLLSPLSLISQSKINRVSFKNPKYSFASDTSPSGQNLVDVFGMAGQSNMVGRADLADLSIPPYSRYSDSIQNTLINTGGIFLRPVIPGDVEGQINDDFGLEVSFSDTLAKSSSETIILYKYSVGGTRLAQDTGDDWHPQSVGEYWDNYKDGYTALPSKLRAFGFQPSIKGFFWVQGENDAIDETYANAYQANLEGLIDSVRAFHQNPDLPIFIGKLKSDSGTAAYNATIRTAQENICGINYNANGTVTTDAATKTLCYLIETSDLLFFDGIHYTADDTVLLGWRLAAAYMYHISNNQ